MGLLWLSTVPPTTGLIATLFGPRYLGMLFGVVFFSHQIGSFLGAWLGGIIYDATLSYDIMWMSTVAAGIFATLVHLPIRDAGVRAAA
jgi:predicted MFS family arabinose efflux permease